MSDWTRKSTPSKGDEYRCVRRFRHRYTLMQSVRHGVRTDWTQYPHTRARIELERGLRRALELHALLEGVSYRRYHKPQRDWQAQEADT